MGRHDGRPRSARRERRAPGSRSAPPTIPSAAPRPGSAMNAEGRRPSDYRELRHRRATRTPLRPLVKTHPDTGSQVALIGRHAHDIPGLVGRVSSSSCLQELIDFACQPPRTYRHDWQTGRRRDLGQPPPAAPGDAVRHDPAAHHVAHPDRRRSGERSGRWLRRRFPARASACASPPSAAR